MAERLARGASPNCTARMYEQGATHEHACLESAPHADLAHTCWCGVTWTWPPTVMEDTPLTDPYADALARAERALREALSAIASASASRPAVRVIHTGDGWQPPPEPVHTCTDQCTATTADMAGVCWLSVGEVERAHRVAQDRHPTPEDTMTDETRFVLIKPGDVLLLGGVHPNSGEEAVETLRRIKDLAGIRAVVAFADEIEIGRLSAEDLARLIEETSRDPF